MCLIGSSPVFGSFDLRLLPMFVKYLLNCSTISFLSVMLVPSEVVNLSFTICFLFFDCDTSFIVFHVFLQSFLYNSNLFLKCIFFDCLMICVSLFFISFIGSLVFNRRILLTFFE